jgi:hypothetical protein
MRRFECLCSLTSRVPRLWALSTQLATWRASRASPTVGHGPVHDRLVQGRGRRCHAQRRLRELAHGDALLGSLPERQRRRVHRMVSPSPTTRMSADASGALAEHVDRSATAGQGVLGLSVQNRERIIGTSHHGKGGSYEEEVLRCCGCPIGGFASCVRRNIVAGWRTAARAVQEDQRKLQRQ